MSSMTPWWPEFFASAGFAGVVGAFGVAFLMMARSHVG